MKRNKTMKTVDVAFWVLLLLVFVSFAAAQTTVTIPDGETAIVSALWTESEASGDGGPRKEWNGSGVEADFPQLMNFRPVACPSTFSAAALPSSPALSRSSVNASMPQRVW